MLNLDGFKSNIKSRKALQIAIDDKSTPRAIKNLKITMNIVLLCLLALGIAEYVTISTQSTDINNNIKMVEKAYGRLSELQRIAYNIRSLVLINEGKLSAYRNYTSSSDYVALVKEDIHEALTSLYDI